MTKDLERELVIVVHEWHRPARRFFLKTAKVISFEWKDTLNENKLNTKTEI